MYAIRVARSAAGCNGDASSISTLASQVIQYDSMIQLIQMCITIHLCDHVGLPESFELQHATRDSGDWVTAHSGTDDNAELAGLGEGNYEFRVRAVNYLG